MNLDASETNIHWEEGSRPTLTFVVPASNWIALDDGNGDNEVKSEEAKSIEDATAALEWTPPS